MSLLVTSGRRAGAESKESRRRIGYDLDPVATLVTRRQHNSAGFDVSLKGITRTDPEPAAKRTGEDNLTLGGYFGPHAKSNLPYSASASQGTKATNKAQFIRSAAHSRAAGPARP
jgi:hypothetical protein